MNPSVMMIFLRNRWILKYMLLFFFSLSMLALAGIILTPLLSGFAYASRYRTWMIKQPGYKHYLSRLPGLRTLDPPLKFSFITLLYLFPSSLLCTWLLWNVFDFTSNWNYIGFIVFCIIGLVPVYTWFTGKWGFRDSSFSIETAGVVKTPYWKKFLAGMELDISS
ncbi:MAG TPA: hypothetical protein VEP90_19610, partial [Methylomirabilota bacterium]|nr:hypothetical protein [Methylomirabilota bacterium]